jgi:TPR repeat protein
MDSYYHHASALLHTLGFGVGFLLFMVGDLCSKAGRKGIKSKSLLIVIVMSVVAVSLFYSIKQEKQWKQTAYQYELSAGLCRTMGKNKDAAYWHEKSIKLAESDPEQQGELGFYTLKGTGIKKNTSRGFYLLQQSALKGNKLAETHLGNCYWDGEGTPRDLEKGFYWSTKAAQQGDGLAQKRLADAYLRGWGTSVDLKQAYYWYSKALNSREAWVMKVDDIKATMRSIKAKLKE